MKIIAAPWRQFKTYSMLLAIFIGGFNAIIALIETLGTIDLLSIKSVLIINAVLGFLLVPAKLILQNIPVTTKQKVDMVAASAAQPIKKGNKNVVVKIDKLTVSSTPEEV